jgi:hypothetical protein
MCKNAGLLVGWDIANVRAFITQADCNEWSCPECAEKLKQHWVLRAETGVRYFLAHDIRVDFVTITSNEKLKTFAQTEYVWRDAWSKIYAALKRKNKALEYFIVPEKHKDGRMHIHALWTAGVTKKWLKDNARKRGLGYMADVSQVNSTRAATGYVTKYVGKSLGEEVPPHFRRVRVSRNWADVPKPETEHNLYRWEYIVDDRDLMTIINRCQMRNITMINAKTGEIYDYTDYSPLDIIYNRV